MKNESRRLSDLDGVGKATLKDFEVLGIQSVKDLAKQSPVALYKKICRITGAQHDICVLDMFACSIAQAKNPQLDKEKRNWWFWSNQRKKRMNVQKK